MTLHLLLMNLAAYSAQIAVLIVVGSAAPYLLRIRRPGAMLIYRHALLAGCLLLLFQPWRRQYVETSSEVTIATGVAQVVTTAPRHFSPEEAIAFTLVAGILARLLWLGLGLRRLRRYRRRAIPLSPLPPVLDDLQLGLPTRVTIALSPEVAGPVAFGVSNPMILLPMQFPALPEPAQRAIVCHEIAHIRRGDWAVTMVEEVIRGLFWFHPCVWWLLGQIQLTREQVVDREVIDLIDARSQYVDALMMVARVRLDPDLTPAPLFLRKSHLTQRVALILEGVSMSKQRLVSSIIAACGALLFTARIAIFYFPVNAPAQEIVRGDANLLHRSPLVYPADAIEHGIEGTVIIEATLNQRGVVTDARILSGPEELRKAALKSVLEWHYSGQVISPVQIAIDFKLPVKRPQPAGGVAGGVIEGIIGGVPPAVRPGTQLDTLDNRLDRIGQPARLFPNLGRVAQIEITGVSSEVRQALAGHIPVSIGDEYRPDTLSRVRQAVREVDEHLEVRIRRSLNSAGISEEVTVVIFSTASMVTETSPAEPPQRIRVGGDVQAAMAISAPRPFYPPLAKQARVQGTVRLAVIIGKDGAVQDIRAESGHPLLVPAAIEAVRTWIYKPTLLNGAPVEVATVVDINFTLSE